MENAALSAKLGNNDAVLGATLLLAIESSCDDTSAAVLRGDRVLSNIVAGQEVHRQYGGVVPELASRAHQQHIVPVVHQALEMAGIRKEELDAIAFTVGPGLLGSLLVGASFAKSLALGLDIPLIAVDHMRAHILAHFIKGEQAPPIFPFLCLTVSGGHTQIVKVDSPSMMTVLGRTIDDAAGEAFDKAAKVLGLGYPGGPTIDRLAKQGDPHHFQFATPKAGGMDYSFSGVKTSFLYLIQKLEREAPGFVPANLPDICASYQRHLVTYLLSVLEQAIAETGVKAIALAGGVSANSELRRRFTELAERSGCTSHVPPLEYCTDNAAMIGIAAQFKLAAGDLAGQHTVPMARLKMG
ncbi:MAG: tRNA (adenosine(37)-N6)-threonylcarbamoyltransferase complex transferase subunit TsaD [Flavobacteriales bacterium]|nr:tRNA (adenosine(37)-N6)-threonylcarbamoyltransferase complex transferase subunit TsaD [Flavobacteriales bacterium]